MEFDIKNVPQRVFEEGIERDSHGEQTSDALSIAADVSPQDSVSGSAHLALHHSLEARFVR